MELGTRHESENCQTQPTLGRSGSCTAMHSPRKIESDRMSQYSLALCPQWQIMTPDYFIRRLSTFLHRICP